GFEAIEGVGDQQWHHLWQHAVEDLFELVGTGGANAFHRAGFNRFHRFGKQLGEHAGGVDKQRQHASTPANGPRPTATTNSMAKTISLMARQASIRRRTGW